MDALAHLSIRTKLIAFVILAVAVPCAVIAVSGTLAYERMVADRIGTVRAVVQAGIGLAKGLNAEVEAGALTQDEALERFRNAVHAMYYNDGVDYMYVYDMNGVAVANPSNHKAVGTDRTGLTDKSPQQKPFVREIVDTMRRQDHAIIHYSWPKLGGTEALEKTNYVQRYEPLGLIVGSGVYTDDIDEAHVAFMLRLGATALALIAVLVLAALLINHSIVTSLNGLRDRMAKLADGDLSVRFPEAARRTEMGAMARALEVFREHAEDRGRLAREQEALRERTARERQQTLDGLATTFEASVGEAIRAISGQTERLQREASVMLEAAGETDRLAGAVSESTRGTSSNVQTVASAAEELSASIDEISRRVTASSRIAQDAAGQAQRANTQVGGLAEAVGKIGAVVEMINDIASQTNLLALNATIEAARAGEAGKGFAVVASEVKQLATQTARATEDIAAQIAGIQSVTNGAVQEIRGIVGVVDQINEHTVTISSAVEEQGAATREIVRSIHQAAEGTRETAADIDGVSGAADRSGQAARGVLDTARLLAAKATDLNGEVGAFLETVRRA